jgi:hypothetical protein
MNGLELIKHTAGGGVMTATTTGGSVSLVKNGKIEFTNATAISVDKCFTGEFDNYVMVMNSISTSSNAGPAGVKCVLRDANGDYSGGTYTSQTLNVNNTSVTGSRGSNWNLLFYLYGWGLTNGNHVYWYGPALGQPTAARTVNVDSFGTARLLDVAATHSEAKAFSGFKLSIANTQYPITGSLTIYGFTKGTP